MTKKPATKVNRISLILTDQGMKHVREFAEAYNESLLGAIEAVFFADRELLDQAYKQGAPRLSQFKVDRRGMRLNALKPLSGMSAEQIAELVALAREKGMIEEQNQD